MVIETCKEVVYVSGTLRSNQWPVIRTAAFLAHEDHPNGVILDFSRVLSVSEMGETTFVAAIDEIIQYDLPFRLCKLPPGIESLLIQCPVELYHDRSTGQGLTRDLWTQTWWNRIWDNA